MSFPSSNPSAPALLPPQTIAVAWWPIAFGLLVLYLPTFFDLARVIWRTEEQAQGPLMLAAAAWLFWLQRKAWQAHRTPPNHLLGWSILVIGLMMYIVGRSQDILLFEISSLIPVLAGALLIQHGWGAIRVFWFPLLYIVFMIPLPGILVDSLTGPLKAWISLIVENLLYHAGYPIARYGVVLSIGQYKLQVADACAGMHSMFSLSALGLFFMFLTRRQSWLHNGLMLASILPITITANIARVILLVLITYHLGDASGQGFLHGFSGIALLMVALLSFFALDRLLARLIKA